MSRLTVIVSQGQSNNPAKRKLEEDLVAALLMERGVEVTVVPHLYDLTAGGTGLLCLQGIEGDMVVLSWLFPRAAHWILDRHNIRGRVGPTLLAAEEDEEEDSDEFAEAAEAENAARVADDRPAPARAIYCLDLRSHPSAGPYVEEIGRIATEIATPVVGLLDWIQGDPSQQQLDRYLDPAASSAQNDHEGNGNGKTSPGEENVPGGRVTRVEEPADRRWYPVIDFSRCTNCMECIDFCLFGVYGVDRAETILVEQPDNCRKGCPACSRICPEHAIIFPQHKAPGIAGSSTADAGNLKIDLSQLFGGGNESADDVAARERDEQLLLAGREPVASAAMLPKRQENRDPAQKDELDAMLDELDVEDV